MDDADTGTVDLTREEARDVINALTNYQVGTSGREEERALNIRSFLEREFGFEEEPSEVDRNLVEEWATSFVGEGDEHEIQLSRAEAEEVVVALADHETQSETEAETIADVRTRFEETFDLDADRAT